jgi:GcrA cell cycle regulator
MGVTRMTWTRERIALLKDRIDAGLSCAQIAREIGVSRNAVIGKVNRLGLSRFKRESAGQPARTGTTRHARPKIATRHRVFPALPTARQLPFVEMPADSTNRRSLLELQQGHCRWPISEPGADDFGFCGGTQVDGLPYCAAHARMAYRTGVRVNFLRRERVASAGLFENPDGHGGPEVLMRTARG